jgi:hypothetical protein
MNELFETFLVGWKIWGETMDTQGIIIKIKIRRFSLLGIVERIG